MSAICLTRCVRPFTPNPSPGLARLHVASPVTRWRNSCNSLLNQKIARRITKVISDRCRTSFTCNSAAPSRNSVDRLENFQRSKRLSSGQQHFGALIRECSLQWARSCTNAIPRNFKVPFQTHLDTWDLLRARGYAFISNLDYGESY